LSCQCSLTRSISSIPSGLLWNIG